MTFEPSSPEQLNVVPTPCELHLEEGITEFSEDVRLVTSNVLPVQRKAMRGIFSDAGIRVVANKKKFVIEVYVRKLEDMDVSNVPESALGGYYEVHIRDNTVTIETVSQEGALWGAQTLSEVYRNFAEEGTITNMTIRDWPCMPQRGLLFVAGTRVEDLDLGGWKGLADAVARLKLNHFGYPVYGWDPEKQVALLNAPRTENAVLKLEDANEVFPEGDMSVPVFVMPEPFKSFIDYTGEKGLCLSPIVDVLGQTAPFARWIPEVAAVDAGGKAKAGGLCLGKDETRALLEAFYGDFLEQFFPNGLGCVLLQVGATQDMPGAELRCECAACSGDAVAEHVAWLAKFVSERGAKRVMVWNVDGCLSDAALAGLNDLEVLTAGSAETVDCPVLSGCDGSFAAGMIGEEIAPKYAPDSALGSLFWHGE